MAKAKAKSAEYGEGWFFGYAPVLNDEGEFVDSRNVIGRFRDHDKIDGPASRAARKAIYRKTTILERRPLMNASGFESKESDCQPIRWEDEYLEASIEAIRRFPEAWAAYQAQRQAEVSEAEREAVIEAFGEAPAVRKPAPAKKPAAKKKPAKAAKPASKPENVVPLKSEVA